MKRFTILTLNTAMIVAILASCGKKDAAAQLEDLRKQQADITAQIKTLETEINKTAPKTGKIIQVAVTNIDLKPFYHYIDVQGKVTSENNIDVKPKAPGLATQILVRRGQNVSKGQVLAILDNAPILKSIEATTPNLELAKQFYNKTKALWEQKIGTEIQYLQAKTNKETLEKSLAALLEQNENFKIKAPIAGIVDDAMLKEGEMANPAMPAFRIVNGSSFKATAEIAEAYIDKVQRGNKVAITFPDISQTIDKNIDVVSDVINVVNRTFNVEVNLGSSAKYKANMITFFKIQDYANKATTVVPINLIQHSDIDGDHVFVAENGKAVKKLVTVGKTYGNDAEIVKGLKTGDKLITVGYQELTDGQAIKF